MTQITLKWTSGRFSGIFCIGQKQESRRATWGELSFLPREWKTPNYALGHCLKSLKWGEIVFTIQWCSSNETEGDSALLLRKPKQCYLDLLEAKDSSSYRWEGLGHIQADTKRKISLKLATVPSPCSVLIACCCLVSQSCPILRRPRGLYSPPGSSVHGSVVCRMLNVCSEGPCKIAQAHFPSKAKWGKEA